MSGRHLKPGRSRFVWEVLRFVLGWALVVALVVSLFWLLQNVLPSLVAGDGSSSSTTSAVEMTSTTSGATTSTIPETTSTLADTTTTTRPEATTTSEAPAVRPPEEITVLVLNSTPRVGLAGSAAARLAAEGYMVATPANASPRRPNTVILHAEGYAAEAEALTEFFEDEAVFGVDDEGRTTDRIPIVVILGASYDS